MIALLIVLVILEALLILRLVAKLRNRYDGNMVVHDTEQKTTFSLEILTDPEKLVKQNSITLKVVNDAEE